MNAQQASHERVTNQDIKTVLPKPTGPYAVGSRYFYLVDKARPDLISPDPDEYWAASLQVWYPAKPGPDDQPILLNDCRSCSSQAYDARFQYVRDKVIRLIADRKPASMSIAVAKDGKILWEESFGWADREKKVHAMPRTKYLSGSIAKTITATGLMTLVEKGLVDLDKPILDYIPHLKIIAHVGKEKSK
jgi:hypothetical protein